MPATLKSPITLTAKKQGGVQIGQEQDEIHFHVDTPISGPRLMRLEEIPPEDRTDTGLTLHRLDLRPSAELSAEVHIRLDSQALATLRDLIDEHLAEERRRTDGLRPTTVR